MRTAVRVMVADSAGGLRMANVCRDCARRGVTLVPFVPRPTCACGARAVVCVACAAAARTAGDRIQTDTATRLRAMADLYDKTPTGRGDAHEDGRLTGTSEGLRQAADIVEAARR